jgi:heat shock protein 5
LNSEERGVKDKISPEDKATIEQAIKEHMDWLDEHPGAEKEDYDEKYKELERLVQPIFSKIYGTAGGGGGSGAGSEEQPPRHDEL